MTQAPARPGPATRFAASSTASSSGSSASAAATAACSRWRWARARLRARLHGGGAAVLRAGPVAGAQLLPAIDAGQINLHVRAPIGTRIEETAAEFDHVEQRSARSSRRPAGRRSSTTSACRSAASTAPTPTPAASDRRTATSWSALKAGHAPTADFVQTLRVPCRAPSRHELRLPARRHHQPDPELRRAGADRRPGHRPERQADVAYRRRPGAAASRHRHGRRSPAAGQRLPGARVDVDRTRAGQLGITERDVTDSL